MNDNNMSRRNVLGALSTVMATAAVAGSGAEAAGKPNKRPNIVFFLGEGIRFDEYSFMGNPIIQTPNIDRLAREGVVFNNAFCTNALCSPSRATIMTGAYSHSTGAVNNLNNFTDKSFLHISDVLHAQGYDVAFLGKNHIGGELMDHYWDYYLSYEGQGKYYNPRMVEGRNGKFEPERQFDGYTDDVLGDHAVKWLNERNSDKPFCLFFWFYAPHAPFYRARRQVDRFNGVRIPKPSNFDEDLAGYPGKPKGVANAFNKIGTTLLDPVRSLEEVVKDHYCGVENNDENVGRVLKVLTQQNVLDETAILFSSDHGFFLGEHTFYDKRLMYEPSIRIPMIIRYPKRIKAGTRRDEMVLTVDIAPTIFDLAGTKTPATAEGKTMMGLAEGKPAGNWRKDWLYEYYEFPGFENVRPCRGVRTERYKYIHHFYETQEYELYDLKADPEEMNNLYGKPGYEAITKQLQTRLEQLRHELNDHYEFKPTAYPESVRMRMPDTLPTSGGRN